MEKRTLAAAKIALFRAREDAARSAARLRRLGFAVACLPVIEIAPLSFAARRGRYDAVVATSAKAFLCEPPIEASAPLYVVGARTARAAEARGWRIAAPPAPDAERLVETLKRETMSGATVLYLAGRDRKPALETALEGFCALEVVEAYAAEARVAWRPAEVRALASCAVALHYSRRSAALAAGLAERAGAAAHFAGMRHVCVSNDAAEPLRAIGAAQVLVADQPEESALFALLSDASSIFPSGRASRI
jgi:uroporphyrinogen-III synthase